jgi:hypothetical protein
MKVNEPNYFGILAQQHESHQAWLEMRQPQLQAELDAQKAARSGASSPLLAASVGPSDVTPGTSTLAPLQPLTDPQALAAAMAASAGNGSSTDPADYLAAATSLAASYAQPAPATVVPAAGETDNSGTSGSKPLGRKLLQGSFTHDLLVVYTPAAATRSGGDAALQNTIRQAVAWTNQAYANSRLSVSLTLRLVGIRAVSVLISNNLLTYHDGSLLELNCQDCSKQLSCASVCDA